jgi:hypothetical protein
MTFGESIFALFVWLLFLWFVVLTYTTTLTDVNWSCTKTEIIKDANPPDIECLQYTRKVK